MRVEPTFGVFLRVEFWCGTLISSALLASNCAPADRYVPNFYSRWHINFDTRNLNCSGENKKKKGPGRPQNPEKWVTDSEAGEL
jgi:hypothetical protein